MAESFNRYIPLFRAFSQRCISTGAKRNIVISAVNLRKGGTLTVLRECLEYLSSRNDLSVTAIVHSRSLCDFPGISYIEISWSAKSWLRRLWCEYVVLPRISKELPPADLWFSLHDTTPGVRATRQAVYCHTSFPFMKVKMRDWRMDAKIPLFALLTRFAYKINIRRNSYLVVQQQWMKEGLSRLVGFPKEKIILCPPAFSAASPSPCVSSKEIVPVFIYPSTPDCHKNFETFCLAASLLQSRIGEGRFKVLITISGNENRYSQWLHKKFGWVSSIDFHGLVSRDALFALYGSSACLVFPSRVESWGLPVSEFKPLGKPMILADLPYAHDTASGAEKVAFFRWNDAETLSRRMEDVLNGDLGAFAQIPDRKLEVPFANNWEELFRLLLEV